MSASTRSHGDPPQKNRTAARQRMVKRQIAARGVSDPAVLQALGEVPREAFVAPEAVEYAYHDTPLPIAEGQTISQPYIVAAMAEAAELGPADRVLEVGTGSGYGAAVLGRIAEQVFTIERHPGLAESASACFRELGYDHIEVRVGDGTLGWPEEAPFDAIVVTAGGPPDPPPALLDQLAPGGRLVIPLERDLTGQELIRIRRSDDGRDLARASLGPVRFVPLIGEGGWPGEGSEPKPRRPPGLVELVESAVEPLDDPETDALDRLLERIGDARLVLLGEASHGTSDFYRLRARITRELVEKRGFDFVAAEADWPDAAEIDAFVRHHPADRPRVKPFQRFPRWMWANVDVMEFVHWLREFNGQVRDAEPGRMVGFHGLDLYSMYTSIDAVLTYLDDVDSEAALAARERYGCLTPWQSDPVLYGRAALKGTFDTCEEEVIGILGDLMDKRFEYGRRDGRRFVDAVQNARLVANAERYYRAMYRGSVSSWNLRDQHMFDTLELLLGVHGAESRGVVWAHNSHLGDASATAMGDRGEHNVGQLVRQRFGKQAFLVGFGTHTGTVAAASDWGAPMEVKRVRPSHPHSYEHLCHETGVERFLLPLRHDPHSDLVRRLSERRLERAIGVIYRPETELQSHYFPAALPRQFDEWIWLDETTAVTPISAEALAAAHPDGVPETYPFGV
ncbi:MAG: protein-L-isoaspartate(D-aspartate) O-methyltransferase [Gemmatimonadetes bacterium]|nr:protein-L-isoaspartate(D-aspartate) O-methyltransferase [Gemmatimonadota bacterium]